MTKQDNTRDWTRIASINDRFEAALRGGSPLQIEDMLGEVGSKDREALFIQLVKLEIEYGRRSHQEVFPSTYFDRFPEYHGAIRRLGDETVDSDSDPITVSNSEPDKVPESLRHIGPYRLIQRIGAGGMGIVYSAEQTDPVTRRVAIKLIQAEYASRSIIARFESERRVLAMMQHPNIASVLDAGTTETGMPYFVMELVQGEKITDYCDRNELSPDDRLSLFVQTCRAVQHAHQKGIIHRDMKPSNVLVSEHDGKPLVKVIDFGLAKAIHTDETDQNRSLLTQHGQVIGTLAYMSPEQAGLNALGSHVADVDTRTDIYSLGVLLYELLTGSTPLSRVDMEKHALDQVLRVIREVEPPRPSSHLSDSGNLIAQISRRRSVTPKRLGVLLRGELDWIVMKALEKDLERRYESAADFAADVQRYLNHDVVEARPHAWSYRVKKSFQKNKASFLVGATVVGLLLAGLIGTGTMWLRALHAEAAAVLETAKTKQTLARTYASQRAPTYTRA